MAESENIPIGEYTKSGLVKELKECIIIDTRLETKCKKREIDSQMKKLTFEQKSFSTKDIQDIIEKDKSVLRKVAIQYQQLHELNGCDKKLCSDKNDADSTTAQSQSSDCDCKKVEEVKAALLKLLKDNYDLCGILKENINLIHIEKKYYPDRAVIPSGGEVVAPETINELVKDICDVMDKILTNCQLLYDADRSSSTGKLPESGYGTRCSYEPDNLAISSSNASSGEYWTDPSRQSRTADEHTDDQTDVKSFE